MGSRLILLFFLLAKRVLPGSVIAMKSLKYIPNSLKDAGCEVRHAFIVRLNRMTKAGFVRVWSSVAYLFPGLHPDGFDDSESGWPSVLRPFAAEAWRRAVLGQLGDDELYPSDAQWAGLYDRMIIHRQDETKRRIELAALSAGGVNV